MVNEMLICFLILDGIKPDVLLFNIKAYVNISLHFFLIYVKASFQHVTRLFFLLLSTQNDHLTNVETLLVCADVSRLRSSLYVESHNSVAASSMRHAPSLLHLRSAVISLSS